MEFRKYAGGLARARAAARSDAKGFLYSTINFPWSKR